MSVDPPLGGSPLFESKDETIDRYVRNSGVWRDN
jgi:hypothetical protein